MTGDRNLEFIHHWESRKLLRQPALLYRLEEILSLQQVLEIVSSNLTREGDHEGSMGGGQFPCLERTGWCTGALQLMGIGAVVLLGSKRSSLAPTKTTLFEVIPSLLVSSTDLCERLLVLLNLHSS